jgi:hypothetical protein
MLWIDIFPLIVNHESLEKDGQKNKINYLFYFLDYSGLINFINLIFFIIIY